MAKYMIIHRDGTVTYWSVYEQAWVCRAESVPDRELAAWGWAERDRWLRVSGGAS